MEPPFTQSVLFVWAIVPLLIFLARIVDVSLQTIRIVAISRGVRWLAPLVGFFEVLIWLLVISQIIKTVSHPLAYIAYAAGFATGTAIGQSIERRLSLGMVLIRVITPSGSEVLRQRLQEMKFGFTHVPAQGAEGPVEVVFTVIRRQHLQQVLELVRRVLPDAFYSVEEVAGAREKIYPAALRPQRDPVFPLRLFSKRK
ncbi:MAG: DUF2179 domain-containing protein [Candidatus Aminicenantes bacterium]|nr:DUF2179 domain-containing protein [Candidatus Aminicenantes bacterium]